MANTSRTLYIKTSVNTFLGRQSPTAVCMLLWPSIEPMLLLLLLCRSAVGRRRCWRPRRSSCGDRSPGTPARIATTIPGTHVASGDWFPVIHSPINIPSVVAFKLMLGLTTGESLCYIITHNVFIRPNC